ncbi:PLC-like phosphodiesterase [Jimgerdemannia flammicorona]|uniref:PLC-like phosphodiesterase n=1 Tax=Jimgerdemannia flammicorona TaxID=994334 RepID=A0A433Q9U3_9FUNG|nr:PLC-like phosphodiesterase [Jimgerdemannia flammicorona]
MARDISPAWKPEVIGHRGLSARNPENTMQSFREALNAGADGIETDIQLTLDGELVVLHDPKLDRTTNGTGAIIDHNWHEHIDGLRTKKAPHLPIPRLNDVLELLMESEIMEKRVWVLLDIKITNGPKVLDTLHAIIAKFPETHDFSRQIVLGLWKPSFIEPAQRLFPKYRLSFIGVSLSAARTVFWGPCDSFNLNFSVLVNGDGQNFIKEAQAAGKKVYVWTVNDPEQARECFKWRVDAILGDDSGQLVAAIAQERVISPSARERVVWLTVSRRIYYFIQGFMWQFISFGV